MPSQPANPSRKSSADVLLPPLNKTTAVIEKKNPSASVPKGFFIVVSLASIATTTQRSTILGTPHHERCRPCRLRGHRVSASAATRYNPVIKQFYLRLLKNGKPKKLALVASMRKLLTILNDMVRGRHALAGTKTIGGEKRGFPRCTSAEPGSVSPSGFTLPLRAAGAKRHPPSLNTGAMPPKTSGVWGLPPKRSWKPDQKIQDF